MCGILGIVNKSTVAHKLLQGLHRLEYRGYDSAGMAFWAPEGLVRVRAIGRVGNLEDTWQQNPVDSAAGIAHTRWATHGDVTLANTHPHGNARVCIIQNGIVENMAQLKEEAKEWGTTFVTTSDAELFAIYLDRAFTQKPPTPDTVAHQVRQALASFEGSFAIVVMVHGLKDTLVALRQGNSPLAVGRSQDQMSCGSDAVALSGVANEIAYLEDGDMAVLTPAHVAITNKEGPKTPSWEENTVKPEAFQKGDHAHFMHKEMHEQYQMLQNLSAHMDDIPGRSYEAALWRALPFIRLSACGTALYAAHMAAFWFETWAALPTIVDIASEVRQKIVHNQDKGLSLFISQSGETADTLAALRHAQEHGQHTLAVLNVPQTSMSRLADKTILTYAGPEVGVASTKAFVAQLWALIHLAFDAGVKRGVLDKSQADELRQTMKALPETIRQTLACEADIQEKAKMLAAARSVLYLGRGPFYPLALEGALKLKEISYIHAEGYAAGEIKHGPIAMIEPGIPVVILAPSGAFLEKTISAIHELSARSADLLILTDVHGKKALEATKQKAIIVLPNVPEVLTPFTQTVALQLLAYHVACLRGQDVDRPRNLAKSVTVE